MARRKATTKQTVDAAVETTNTNVQENTMQAQAIDIRTVAKISHKRPVAFVLERDLPRVEGRRVKCPECGLRNVITGTNVKCKGCGFMIAVKLNPDFDRYVRGMAETPSGRDTVDIDDHVAQTLRGLDAWGALRTTANALAQMDRTKVLSKALAKATREIPWTLTGITEFLQARYEGRNPGMVRMNCGNILRKAVEKHDDAPLAI